jgi:hypothetical protein
MTELQKLRAQLAATIAANQFPDGVVNASHKEATDLAKRIAAGAVKVADEIILEVTKR